jgi:diketogulonate reductase-like aldo/keto reductase
MSTSQNTKLNNGIKIPKLGFGTWQLRNEKLIEPLTWAFEAGYRHVDTAMAYTNEKAVGQTIKESQLTREEIFVTTKLWIMYFEAEKTMEAIDKSLNRLGMKYVDLFLVHWPAEGYLEIWKSMEKILAEGKARAIGVSNFKINHLENLLEEADIIPAVNQIECTPYNYNKELIDYCKSKDIKIEAYSPITRGLKLSDPKLIELASKYNKTAAQILLRWNLEIGSIVIPKSTNKKRIIENSEIFDFTIAHQDMKLLSSFNENLRVPGSKKHKELAIKYLDT